MESIEAFEAAWNGGKPILYWEAKHLRLWSGKGASTVHHWLHHGWLSKYAGPLPWSSRFGIERHCLIVALRARGNRAEEIREAMGCLR